MNSFIKSNININNKVCSIQEFCNIDNKIINNSKNTVFIRLIGFDEPTKYINDIKEMDKVLNQKSSDGFGGYLRLDSFPKPMDISQTQYYSEKYDIWTNNNKKNLYLKNNIPNSCIMNTFNTQLINLENLFSKTSGVNSSICKNFIVKSMYWLDNIIDKIFKNSSNEFMAKLVVNCNVKKQEYLFLNFLAKSGVDVMVLLPECDLQLDEDLKAYSKKVTMPKKGKITIPKYEITKTFYSNFSETSRPSIKIPPRPYQVPPTHNAQSQYEPRLQQRTVVSQFNQGQNTHSSTLSPLIIKETNRQELSFEELAQLASSVVMIGVHNRKGDIIASGSGIMISKEGYILTNFHVIERGAFYSVRIENDNNIYQTDNIIKYHNVFDLAVIRINRSCSPLKIYNQAKPLVRGQKVVAIGSPLGLFNSVSDGIISGFRNIDMMDMIQFTAPISSGSSGGAVLNMYGEVIGISTAGIDKGQNINLAVDYKIINNFIVGFVN